MNIDKYIKGYNLNKYGIQIELVDGSRHTLNSDSYTGFSLINYIKENLYTENIFTGYVGGSYEDCGLFGNKKDAERGLFADRKLHEIFDEFEGKKVRITIEEVDEGE